MQQRRAGMQPAGPCPAAAAGRAAADELGVDECCSAKSSRSRFGALRANKLRSLLTMLGIVIGVAAVIAMIALGSGAQQAVKDRIKALGTTLLTVSPGQQRMGGGFASEADRAR